MGELFIGQEEPKGWGSMSMVGVNGRKDDCALLLFLTVAAVSAGAARHAQAAGLLPKGFLLLSNPHSLDLFRALLMRCSCGSTSSRSPVPLTFFVINLKGTRNLSVDVQASVLSLILCFGSSSISCSGVLS